MSASLQAQRVKPLALPAQRIEPPALPAQPALESGTHLRKLEGGSERSIPLARRGTGDSFRGQGVVPKA